MLGSTGKETAHIGGGATVATASAKALFKTTPRTSTKPAATAMPARYFCQNARFGMNQ